MYDSSMMPELLSQDHQLRRAVEDYIAIGQSLRADTEQRLQMVFDFNSMLQRCKAMPGKATERRVAS